jgi:hypothetical protein
MTTLHGTTRRSALAGIGTVLAVLILASACGGSPSEPGPAPSGAPARIPTDAPPGGTTSGRPVPAPDPLTATPPSGGTVVPATQVDAESLPAGFPTLVWTRGPRTLGVYGRAGGCTEARVELAEQTAEKVVLRVVQYSTGPGPCTRELRYPPLEAPLAADLGDRRVVLTGVAA